MFLYTPCHQDPGNFWSESLSHFSAAHISNAVQGQVHEGRIAAGQVILDGIVDQTDQVAVRVHQHWDEQVTLKGDMGTTFTHTQRVFHTNILDVNDKWSTSGNFK